MITIIQIIIKRALKFIEYLGAIVHTTRDPVKCSFPVQCFRCGSATTVYHGIEKQFLLRPLDDALLHRALGHEAVYVHGFGLADPVDASHSLDVRLPMERK